MSSHLLQYDTDLYKQNVITEQSENDHCLRKVSIQSKLLLINLKNRIDINVHKNESSNVSVVQDKSFTNCQLKVSQVCNETDAQLIIFKYKKNTMKRKRRASYRSKKIMCFSLKVLVSN